MKPVTSYYTGFVSQGSSPGVAFYLFLDAVITELCVKIENGSTTLMLRAWRRGRTRNRLSRGPIGGYLVCLANATAFRSRPAGSYRGKRFIGDPSCDCAFRV